MKRLIQNVGILDMTAATEQSVENLAIRNAGAVVVTKTTKSLVSKIRFENLGGIIEIEDGTTITEMNGNLTISGSTVDPEYTKNSFKLMNGNMVVKNDVSPAMLSAIFASGGMLNGNIVLPDNLSPILNAMAVKVNGNLNVYPHDYTVYTHSIKINNGFLNGLQANSRIFVAGDVYIDSDTDAEFFKNNIGRLICSNAVLHQSAKDAFYKAAEKYDDVTVVPDGYTYVEKEVTITPSNITSYKGKNIFTKNMVIVENGISKEMIEQIGSIVTKGMLLCSQDTAQYLAEKVDAETVQTYGGTLMTVYDNYDLYADDLQLDEKTSWLVRGLLNIDQDVTVELINDKISDVLLYGEIRLNKKQRGAISRKIRVNSGGIEYSDKTPVEVPIKPADEEKYEIVCKNAAKYVL